MLQLLSPVLYISLLILIVNYLFAFLFDNGNAECNSNIDKSSNNDVIDEISNNRMIKTITSRIICMQTIMVMK